MVCKMNINTLTKFLSDCTICCNTPLAACKPETGIHFLFPSPLQPLPYSIYAGNYSDWERILAGNNLINGSTYLICVPDDFSSPLFPTQPINVYFLNTTLENLLESLTEFFQHTLQKHQDTDKILYAFWDDVINKRITERAEFRKRMEDLPYPLRDSMACIVIRSEHTSLLQGKRAEINRALYNFFKNINVFYYQKEWIVLYSQEKDTSHELDFSYEDFSTLLEKYQLNAGISYACKLPEIFRIMYLTASVSIDLGINLGVKPDVKRIYTYQQFNPYYVIHLAAQKYIELYKTENLIYLAHPDIVRLYYYDIENNNNLLDVLFTYLLHGHNLTATSKALYMHRNTAMNKLNKIQEILMHKIDDGENQFLLLLSCMILKYQHTYLGKNITDCF